MISKKGISSSTAKWSFKTVTIMRWEVRVQEETGCRVTSCSGSVPSHLVPLVPPPTVCRIALIRCCSHTLSELSETGCALPGNVFPAQVPARAAEQAASPVEEAGVISQEQEEHRGGKHRHTGEPLKPRHVSRCSLKKKNYITWIIKKPTWFIKHTSLNYIITWSIM